LLQPGISGESESGEELESYRGGQVVAEAAFHVPVSNPQVAAEGSDSRQRRMPPSAATWPACGGDSCCDSRLRVYLKITPKEHAWGPSATAGGGVLPRPLLDGDASSLELCSASFNPFPLGR
jgi:hypothetical protein